jgi:WD40 repeat protein
VAGSSLHLFTTYNEPECEWRKPLPSPALVARLSYDSAYIASIGQHDRLVKVWRRLTYDSNEGRFDFSYLRHPQIVVNLRWRQPYHVDQSVDNVLYTFCADNKVRVWTGSDGHGAQLLHLWAQIDLAASTGDALFKQPTTSQPARWSFVVDGRDFSAATEKAVETRDGADVALSRLVAIATKTPEVCVTFDSTGFMSAWALENVGCKSHSSPNIFNIAQAKSRDFDQLRSVSSGELGVHTEIHCYCDRQTGLLHFLVHFFDGKVEVYTAGVADLFDPSINDKRLGLACVWSGHSSSVRKIVRNFSGRAVVSRTADGESMVWRHHLYSQNTRLSRQSVIPEAGHIHRICVLRKGRFVVFLRHESISLWDCRQSRAVLMARRGYTLAGKPLCLVILPRQRVDDYARAHIATVTSEQKGMVWQVDLPQYAQQTSGAIPNGHIEASIREFCKFELEKAEGLSYMLPVDPAGASPTVAGFLDVFARDVAISYTHSGQIAFWTARVDQEQGQVGWLLTSSVETGLINPALVSGSTLKKAALVNSTRSQVTIWDVGGARLEYAGDFEAHNMIQDLDWTSTPDSQSILAVGFQYRVILLSQMRFDYLNQGPAWASIREISIREFTPHPIGDSTWLGDGHLVIGAGNQLFVHDRSVDLSDAHATGFRLPHAKDGTGDLFDVVQRFNGPLPVFHPQFLSQCILVGKTDLVRRIMVSMHRALKFLVEGEVLDDYLDLDLEEFYISGVSETRS